MFQYEMPTLKAMTNLAHMVCQNGGVSGDDVLCMSGGMSSDIKARD